MSDYRFTIQLIAAVLMLIVGSALLIAGFRTEPIGEIHNSVLIAFGEILTWTGSLFGFGTVYSSRIHAMRQKLEQYAKEEKEVKEDEK